MHHTRIVQSARNAAVCVFCSLLWILISAQVSHRLPDFTIMSEGLHSSAGSYFTYDSSRNETHQAIPASEFNISVDTTLEFKSDELPFEQVKQRIQRIFSPDELNSSSGNADYDNLLTWARLSGKRAAATANTAGQPEVYAASEPDGTSVYLQNRQLLPVNVTLRTTLTKGVYFIERLNISPGESTPLVRLQRLQGVDISAKTTVVKPCHIDAGQICIVRFTDSSRAARVEYNNLQNQVHALAGSSPEPARKLRRILHEGDPYLGCLGASQSSRRSVKRLGCIHRLLLLTSQAESLQHNNLARKTIAGEAGKKVMSALERFASSLSETSAVLLGLVPQIENEAFLPPAAVHKSTKPALSLVSHDHQKPEPTAIRVSLANNGRFPVTLVKIGLDTSGLPTGTTIDPADPAVFATLRPGQTVRAVFQVNVPSGDLNTPIRLRGEISYFAESAPAKLRPQLW